MNAEWQTSPIDCQKVADLAGADHRAEIVAESGPVRYCRTHKVLENLDRLALGGPCILLSSFGDASATDDIAAALPSNVRHWFANNADATSPRVSALPVGFVYSDDMLAAIVAQASAPRPKPQNLLYVNFTRHHKAYRPTVDRVAVWWKFAQQKWATATSPKPPPEYFADLAAHDFVLSPPGAGPDCHRHWEAMALGSIPVVQRSKAMGILEDMPALLVDDWDDVTPERLDAERQPLVARFDSPAMRKLSLSYWRERMAACA
jgi:hypothetical protein